MLHRIFLDVLAGRGAEDMREKLGRSAVVIEDCTWLLHHWPIDGVLHPIELPSMMPAEFRGFSYGRSSNHSNPVVIVKTCRMVMRRLRSSKLAMCDSSKYFRMGVSSLGNSSRLERSDDDGCDRLTHRLQCVQIAAAIVGMPPGVEVVVRPREIVRIERAVLASFGPVDAVVIVFVGPL